MILTSEDCQIQFLQAFVRFCFIFVFVLYLKTCYICDEQGRESKAATGACMTCNKHGCRQAFHVTW